MKVYCAILGFQIDRERDCGASGRHPAKEEPEKETEEAAEGQDPYERTSQKDYEAQRQAEGAKPF